MKELLVLAAAFLIILNGVKAQDSDKKTNPSGYASLNAGVGIPLGEFSDQEIGGASSGGCFHLNISAPLFRSHFGVTSKIDIGVYDMSATPFIAEQKAQMKAFGFGLQDGVDYKFTPVSSGSYTHNNILVGLYVTAPLKRFSFDARFLGGVNFTDRPASQIHFDLILTGEERQYYETASNSTSFAYDIGFGVRYNIGKKQKLCLLLSLDFIGAEGSFTYDTERLYYDSATGYLEEYSEPKEIHASYSVSTYNINFGVGYVFGEKSK